MPLGQSIFLFLVSYLILSGDKITLKNSLPIKTQRDRAPSKIFCLRPLTSMVSILSPTSWHGAKDITPLSQTFRLFHRTVNFYRKHLKLALHHHCNELVIINFTIAIKVGTFDQCVHIIDWGTIGSEKGCEFFGANKTRVVLIVLPER